MSQIAIIAAIGQNGELGFQNQLLCHLPNDLKHFKELTAGHTVLMGRRTWASLPVKPLPKRRNIVLSRHMQAAPEGAEVFSSLEDAIASCSADEQLFIIGGGDIYRQAMHLADTMYLTRIQSAFTADVFFPAIDENTWVLQNDIFVPRDEKNLFDCHFQTFCRK